MSGCRLVTATTSPPAEGAILRRELAGHVSSATTSLVSQSSSRTHGAAPNSSARPPPQAPLLATCRRRALRGCAVEMLGNPSFATNGTLVPFLSNVSVFSSRTFAGTGVVSLGLYSAVNECSVITHLATSFSIAWHEPRGLSSQPRRTASPSSSHCQSRPRHLWPDAVDTATAFLSTTRPSASFNASFGGCWTRLRAVGRGLPQTEPRYTDHTTDAAQRFQKHDCAGFEPSARFSLLPTHRLASLPMHSLATAHHRSQARRRCYRRPHTPATHDATPVRPQPHRFLLRPATVFRVGLDLRASLPGDRVTCTLDARICLRVAGSQGVSDDTRPSPDI
uniref:Uncharacterized protein n=1 Tax=Mycena chlorophos TaxID=658473 RepID=A0ABQ0L9B7_MYCCL|nr:predicted protein [Mycena chlorophos]